MQHLACIMDGNRRFAKKRGWKPWIGHKKGVDAVRTVVTFCLQQKIQYLSLYTFSLENFKRSEEEKKYLFWLIKQQAEKNNIDELKEKGVHAQFLGDRSLFPTDVLPACERIEQETKGGSNLQVHFLFCYGGQQEIIYATKKLIDLVQQGVITRDQVNEQLFAQQLWLAQVPPPELIIRTGGVKRLSNFLLYQAAYSELYFSDCLWPEITDEHLAEALVFFETQKRNFGK